MDDYKFAMFYQALFFVIFIGMIFFNEGLSKFLLFRPGWIFFMGLLIVIIGIFLSLNGSEISQVFLDKIKNDNSFKKDLYRKLADGYLVQVKVFDYVLIPVGSGFIVSAIFLRFSLLLKIKDDKYKVDLNLILKKRNSLSNERRDMIYYLDNRVRGVGLIRKHKFISNLQDELWDAENEFEKNFGVFNYKYYRKFQYK